MPVKAFHLFGEYIKWISIYTQGLMVLIEIDII